VGDVLAGHTAGEAQYVGAIATIVDRVGRARAVLGTARAVLGTARAVLGITRAVLGTARTLRAVDLEVPRVTA
jgi:hypothetical protein